MRHVVVYAILFALALLLMKSLSTFGCAPIDDDPRGCSRTPPTLTPTATRIPPKPQPTPVKTATPVPPKGTSPGDAMKAVDAWQSIGPRGRAWYRIDIPNVNHVLDIWLDANGQGNVGFAVFSNYQADQGLTANTQPTGRGSKNRFFSNDLRWSGRAPRGGSWYVLVTNDNDFPVTYKVGTNVTEMAPKSCHSYWEYLPNGQYVYWTACE